MIHPTIKPLLFSPDTILMLMVVAGVGTCGLLVAMVWLI